MRTALFLSLIRHNENCWLWNEFVDISPLSDKISIHAGVAELADALRSGRSEHSARESSNLSFGTRDLLQWRSFYFPKRPIAKQTCGGTIFATKTAMFKKLVEKLKNIHWSDRRLITVVVIVILVILMMDFNNRMSTMIQLNQMETILETKLAGLEATQLVVEEDIAYATSDRALEEWAREKYRLIAEGDHPIIIMPPSDYTPTPTPTPKPETVVLTRLEIWKELIFGGEELP